MRFFFQSVIILLLFVFTSCGRCISDDESEYYVKYMAVAVSEAIAVEEHPIIVAVPAVYKVQGNSTTCFCKQSFDKDLKKRYPYFSTLLKVPQVLFLL